MLFSRELTIKILEGRKSETRRRVQIDPTFGTRKACYYRQGGNYGLCRPMVLAEAVTDRERAIIKGETRGRPPKFEVGRIRIVSVDLQHLGDIDQAAAHREGFDSPAAFKAYWVRLWDKQWIRRQEHTDDDVVSVKLTDQDLLARFDEKWAAIEVYAIRFDVEDTTVFLAERGHGDYVTTERDQHGRRVAMVTEVSTRPVERDPNLPAGVAGWEHGDTVLAPEEAVPSAVIDSWKGDTYSTHHRIKQDIKDGRRRGSDRRVEVRSKADTAKRIQMAIARGKLHGIPTKAKVKSIRYAMEAGRVGHVERLLVELERTVDREETIAHAA